MEWPEEEEAGEERARIGGRKKNNTILNELQGVKNNR
jgi:hypothetical protein